MSKQETIAAIATAAGPGGIGVVRISGCRAEQILLKLFNPSKGYKVQSHHMLHGWLINPGTRSKVDQAMACLMRGPRSYTGEDVAEIYCHGGMTIVRHVLALALSAGARLAERGEFTKRAFINGKLDLLQAEAVLDLVSAQTLPGAGHAARQLDGRLSQEINSLKQRLLSLLAGLEAQIDFPDDVPKADYKALGRSLKALIKEIEKKLLSAESGRVFRHGLAAAITGRPNAGKSSLLNALLGEDRAIVAKQAGTTRDTIEEVINISGLALRMVDTAGLRGSRSEVEQIGVKRAQNELKAADLVIVVIDSSKKLGKADIKALQQLKGRPVLAVLNKSDLLKATGKRQILKLFGNIPVFTTSALYGRGINQLKNGIYAYVKDKLKIIGKDALAINARHAECLKRAQNSLILAFDSVSRGLPADFVTIDIKTAVVALGEITGELVSDEVISKIFDKFCIGK